MAFVIVMAIALESTRFTSTDVCYQSTRKATISYCTLVRNLSRLRDH
jgi:hypothetical protein